MSRGVNKVILVGRIGQDPEIKYMPSGAAVASFSIATSEQWTDKNSGQKQEKTQWHNCTAFARTAEIIGEFVKKGSELYVEGSLDHQSWDDKQSGEKKYRTIVKVLSVQLLGGKGQGNQQNSAPNQHQAPVQGGEFSDDIPF